MIGLLQRIFHRYGIPLNISKSMALNQSTLFKTITDLLDTPPLYHRKSVLALLKNPLISLFPDAGTGNEFHQVNRVSRELKIIQGKDTWKHKILFRIHLLGDENPDHPDIPMLRNVLSKLEFLFDLLEPFDKKQSFSDHLTGLLSVLDSLRIRNQLESFAGSVESCNPIIDKYFEYSIRAYTCFLELNDELQRYLQEYSSDNLITLREFREYLPRFIHGAGYQLTTMGEDRVQALGRLENRGLSFKHVYFGGMTERALPAPETISSFWSPQLKTLLLDIDPAYRKYQAYSDVYRLLLTPSESITFSRPLYKGDEPLNSSAVWQKLKLICAGELVSAERAIPVTIQEDFEKRVRTFYRSIPKTWPKHQGYRCLLRNTAVIIDTLTGQMPYNGMIRSGYVRQEILKKNGRQFIRIQSGISSEMSQTVFL